MIELRNSDANSSINLIEFQIEKEFANENLKQIDEHLILKAYYRLMSNFSHLICNFDLLKILIYRVLDTNKEGGSILIFMPSYNEIARFKEILRKDKCFSEKCIQILTIHSDMGVKELENIYESTDRKIVIHIFVNKLLKNE